MKPLNETVNPNFDEKNYVRQTAFELLTIFASIIAIIYFSSFIFKKEFYQSLGIEIISTGIFILTSIPIVHSILTCKRREKYFHSMSSGSHIYAVAMVLNAVCGSFLLKAIYGG
jgi:hypothetical protein